MGDLLLPHIHLAGWSKFRAFKGLGGQVCTGAGGALLSAGLGLTIYGKGVSTLDLSGPGTLLLEVLFCSSFDSVLVLRFCVCVLGRGWGEALLPGTAGGHSSLLCRCLGSTACGFGLLFPRSNSVSR